MNEKKAKKIVTIGGGSGQYVLLSGLRDLPDIEITAVVSMMDSGGSTGRLRDELGVLPPGDILKCVLALSSMREAARLVLQKRFDGGGKLDGHSVGNMLLTMLAQYTDDFPASVCALAKILDARGTVLPVTTDKATLAAELSDGSRLYGEAAIDVPEGGRRGKIERTYLLAHSKGDIRVHPPVLDAIAAADYILIGPGDLYTSITPNFLVPGVKEAIGAARAKLIYLVNIMTKFGETDGFSGHDFILNLEKFMGRKVDAAVFNAARPAEEVLRKYGAQKAEMVVPGPVSERDERAIIEEDLLNTSGDIARHDARKLAELIRRLIV